MTVKKPRSGGLAAIVARQKLHNSIQQLDILSIPKTTLQIYNIVVGFNEKDQLQFLTKEESSDDDKQKLINDYTELKASKYENISIDDIANCVNIENYPNCENTLVFYVNKNLNKEAIALKFENEQDFKRIYFTYKYFKMRNRLTNNTNNYASSESLFSKKKSFELFNRNRKSSVDDYSLLDKNREYDLIQTIDNDGVTHISVQQKHLGSRFDQPLSLIGIRSDVDAGEIDSVIYTDIDVAKPDRKRLFHKKSKAPPPPLLLKDNQPKVLKGEFVRVNVDRAPDVIPRDSKHNRIPDILMFREKPKRNSPTSTLWSASNKEQSFDERDLVTSKPSSILLGGTEEHLPTPKLTKSKHAKNGAPSTGGGKLYIPPDEALDRVASILGVTCSGLTEEFGGDAEPIDHQAPLIEIVDFGPLPEQPSAIVTSDIPVTSAEINAAPKHFIFNSSKTTVTTGYESDREEWKSSRSQFSTTAFDSLARPAKVAMALTLKKPQRLDPVQYYRLPNEQPKLAPIPFRPNNYLQRPPRLPRPNPEIKRNFLNTDHRKYTSLQSLELTKKLSEPRKLVDVKKTNYSNISHRITGLTNKLRDLGSPGNTLGRFKAQSHGDVANLKPVLKTNMQDGTKRSVVRTCSAEPPKKVTFSAFATVQVV